MDIIERYLEAVAAQLPTEDREDIVAELRDLILSRVEAREEELGRTLSDEEKEAILHEIGHPLIVAARYRKGPDSLIGPWPEAEQTYLDRSPVTQLENLKTPMLILQGLKDKVVPPNQAYAMADAVRAAGKPLALVTFEDEGHGFRGMAARRDALAAKVSFLQQVFGMGHSPDVPVLAIENLDS